MPRKLMYSPESLGALIRNRSVTSRGDLLTRFPAAYAAAYRHGWLDELIPLKEPRRPAPTAGKVAQPAAPAQAPDGPTATQPPPQPAQPSAAPAARAADPFLW